MAEKPVGEDLSAIRRLVLEAMTAMEASDAARARAALETLLARAQAATSPEGVQAFLRGLGLSIGLGLMLQGPDTAQQFLDELEQRLQRLGVPALTQAFHATLTTAHRDIATFRQRGRGRSGAVALFFELHGGWLPRDEQAGGHTPQAGGRILRQVAEHGSSDAAFVLTGMVLHIVNRIVHQMSQAGTLGELVIWLDEAEPYILHCCPEEITNLIAAWSAGYRHATSRAPTLAAFENAMDRTEAMLARAPAPPDFDQTSWELEKDNLRRVIALGAQLDYACAFGTLAEQRQAARRMLESGYQARLKPELRDLLERMAAGKNPIASTVPVWDPGYSRLQLLKGWEHIRAHRWQDACDIAAPLAAAHPERNGVFAAGVPFLIALCVRAGAPHEKGAASAAIALLKEAVRQTERQRLESAEQAGTALDLMASEITSAPYRHLRAVLADEGRIGEAIRVEMLLAERYVCLPAARDGTLGEQAAERLPCFPGESEFWARVKAAAASVTPERRGLWRRRPAGATGAAWLARSLRTPPSLPLADGRGPAPLPLCPVRDGEVHLAFTQAGDRIAAVVRTPGSGEELVWTPVDPAGLHRAIAQLLAAIRLGSASIQDEAEELGDMLIRPIAPLLRALSPRRLLIEPAGAIGHVPFAVLRMDDACLAQRFELVLQGGWPATPPSGPRGSIVSIGAAAHGSHDALRWVDEDLKLVTAFAARTGQPVETFGMKGTPARKEPILRRLAGPCWILHLSSHFDAQVLDMAASSFLLDDGDRLSVAELSGCALGDCDLALLLGCETAARPPAEPQSPIVGVDAALLRLGVRSVVTSQWPVDDLASHVFLRAFLDAMAVPGTGKAAAFRAAQLSVMNSEYEHLRHPLHWAAFTLAGQA